MTIGGTCQRRAILLPRGPKPGNSALSGDWSGLCTWLSLAFLGMLLSGIASATSRIGPAIYHVRLTCTVTGVPASLGITERRLCDEARAAIQELADGDIDANVATAEGWKKFATPNKQVVLQECLEREQGAGACTGYYLLYQGQQVPIIEVDKDAIDKNDPEGVTVIVTLARSTAADSIAVAGDIIEPPFITMPQCR